MILPKGYGYESKGQDRWAMTWMMMNHRRVSDSAYIEYKVQYDTAPQKPVTPYWLDVKNCLFDPIFDVPGGGKKGSTHRKSFNWTAPSPAGSSPAAATCTAARRTCRSTAAGASCMRRSPRGALPGTRSTTSRPVLHEPGPIHMSEFTSAKGFARAPRRDAATGRRLRRPAAAHPGDGHLHPVHGGGRPRGGREGLRQAQRTCATGRPPMRGPHEGAALQGADHRHRATARRARSPRRRGARKRLRERRAASTWATSSSPAQRVDPLGAAGCNWAFNSRELHNMTVASGPRGFSSTHLDQGRGSSKRLRKPGTYKLFCGLHPVTMTQTIKVTKR